jgi:hypothetical protein
MSSVSCCGYSWVKISSGTRLSGYVVDLCRYGRKLFDHPEDLHRRWHAAWVPNAHDNWFVIGIRYGNLLRPDAAEG